LEEDEELDITMECKRLDGEPENRVFLTWVLLEKSPTDI